MRKLIVTMLLFCSTALFAQGVDIDFLALLNWANMIDDGTKSWNVRCTGQVTSDAQCAFMKKILDRELVYFIFIAKRYNPPPSKDCLDALHPAAIRNQIATAQWNLDCATHALDDVACVERSNVIDAESQRIKKAVTACSDVKL